MSGQLRRLFGGGLAVAMLAVTFAACGSDEKDAAPPAEVVLERAAETTVPFSVATAGEVVLDITTEAPGVSWGTVGSESAVVSMFVDGNYTTDLVIPASFAIRRSLALGSLTAGEHALRLQFAADRSPQGSTQAKLSRFAFRTITPGDSHYAAARNAPVLYGRTTPNPALLAGTPATGPYQNALTDSPLVAFYSETETAISGHRLLTYSMIWSNEDGGTSTPALMAQWGRTTDIEWTYRVEVDAAGNAVPGSATVQGPDHVDTPFTGKVEGTHPVLQTCTLNNNICNQTDGQMRFSLAVGDPLDPVNQAREHVMDENPWTYWVMAQEVNREGKVTEAPEASSTEQIADPRTYLYLVLRKTTSKPNTDNAWIGVSVGVRLSGNPTTFRSNQVYPAWSLERDSPAQTAIALPPGTVAEDIASIQATRVVGKGYDTGASVQIDSIEQAFFLDPDGLPQESFLFTPAKATLTAGSPTATLFRRTGGAS
ncbi:hypothetical protein Ga0074812_12154 [Parafrankia irregularis]|uniref:Lipoprotein n=1 Tax=Parafrankia irregularis TaxID=795642 RepID=A0A0S4QW74_9ACTN|nr:MULTISPECIES: hypothetical protein [Parafrankia]MBE3205096.1 hypothetical protein [Parafrankia sp. CH37]CUU58678.1 hypothetical protein Ga0074812_12154 [Parafrankia irregularis]